MSGEEDHADPEEIVVIPNQANQKKEEKEAHEHVVPSSAETPAAANKTKEQERQGLTDAEAEAQYEIWGYNELPVVEIPLWWVFIQQFMGTMPYMLELAIIISAAVQDWADFGIIIAMVSLIFTFL